MKSCSCSKTTRWATWIGLGLVLAWLVHHVRRARARRRAAAAADGSSTALTAAPGVQHPTIDSPFACSTRTLHKYRLGSLAPLQPPPEGSEWRGCWPGYVGTGSDSGGATGCKNAYNGKLAPPQKFRRTGKQWYGCSFNTEHELWECPTCEV